MAKRCLDKVTIGGVDYPLMQLSNFDVLANYAGWDRNATNGGTSYITSNGSDFQTIGETWNSSGTIDYDITSANNASLRLAYVNSSVRTKDFLFDKDNSDCRTHNSYASYNQGLHYYVAIIIDDEIRLGYVLMYRIFPNSSWEVYVYNDENGDKAYCTKVYEAFGIGVPITSNGGGATHIAKRTGQLKDLSSYTSDILMVSGGGGGGYLTGVPGWDGHEIDILWSGENNKMTAQRANDILTFKLYISGTEIYSFNSPVIDPSNINLSFASDPENQVARPAFVYYDGSSSYSYNQEAPTDEEMADIYTWLSAGLS